MNNNTPVAMIIELEAESNEEASLKHFSWLLIATMATFICVSGRAEETKDDKLSVTFGGFVDTYYAYDFNNPATHDRAFTTQPSRSNEFNVNLAYLDAKVSSDRIRGRFALQTGTSVQANYASETVLAQHIQEAVVGYRIADRLWVDAGIHFSHIGFENWVSKENWTYSRSLIADFSPYYQAGVKVGYQWTDELFTCLHLLNGWQNITDNNGNKALGLQVIFTPTEKLTATYNNFFGNELGSRHRFFNDFILKYALTDHLSLAGEYDIGWQQTADRNSNDVWQGYAVFLRYQTTPKLAFTIRGEQYFDKNQVIVTTGTPNGFQTTGASINGDVALHKNVTWRTEVRGLWSKDKIYPSKAQGLLASDGFVVTSLSLGIP